MQYKDWRAKAEGKMYHLRCYIKKCERNAKWWSKEAKEVKKHRHLLKKEKEKLIARAI
jgi:hypothetical protein